MKSGEHTQSMISCLFTCFLAFIMVVSAPAEQWNQYDNPNLFSADLVTTLQDLPLRGEANDIPWAGNYWPVYKDSINDTWEGTGTKPPSQKYAEAFGYDADVVMDQVSLYHGIDSQSHRRSCINDSQCPSNLGKCSKRSGQTIGFCIPTWFGIDHAWAPVSILLAEPKHEVVHNGVNFKINDIKALISIIYNRTVTRFASLRCNTDDANIQVDDYDRPTGVDSECRDTNPGTFHLLLTNYIGIRGSSFVADATWDDEVRNEPIRGYRIVYQNTISAKEANRLIGLTETGVTVGHANGTVIKNEWFHMDPISVESGDSISVHMTGTSDSDLYVHFDSQPTDSVYDCRPYQGSSEEKCQLTASADTQLYISVKGYAEISNFVINAHINKDVPDIYQFNSNATDFHHVKIEVDYITSPDPSIDGYLGQRIDLYTATNTYEYVLESKKNSEGKSQIVGGEYIDLSKRNHPDFLWLPISYQGDSVAGGIIKRADVMTIYNKSQVIDDVDVDNRFKAVSYNSTIIKDDIKHYGPYNVEVGKNLIAVMTGSNDADLYVRAGYPPTKTLYDCRPYKSGSSEDCHVLSNGAPIYVAVVGYASKSNFNLSIQYNETDVGIDIANPITEVAHLNFQDSVTKGDAKHYVISLPNGYSLKIQTFSLNDIDIYLQENRPASISDYLRRAYTSSGNETIFYTPSSDVSLHIMVYGYEPTQKFVLKTTYSNNP